MPYENKSKIVVSRAERDCTHRFGIPLSFSALLDYYRFIQDGAVHQRDKSGLDSERVGAEQL